MREVDKYYQLNVLESEDGRGPFGWRIIKISCVKKGTASYGRAFGRLVRETETLSFGTWAEAFLDGAQAMKAL